jgi:tetratricopeptide (TPR) repeat protein
MIVTAITRRFTEMVCSPTEPSPEREPDSDVSQVDKGVKASNRDEKKEKRLRALINNASTVIEDARELGADVASSKELIKKAEKALKGFEYKEVPVLVRNAKAEATEAKRFFRAERIIQNVIPVVEHADEMGADISEAMIFLRKAKASLQEKNFGLVSAYVKDVRNVIRQSKKRKKSNDILERMYGQIEKSEEEQLDVSQAKEIMKTAGKAVIEDRHPEVQKCFQKMKKAISDAKLKKKMEDKLQNLRMDLEELKSMGVDTSAGEETLRKARLAMEEGKYSKMQNLIQRNRRWITRERKKRETEFLMDAVGTLMEKASRGGDDFLGAKELLKTFKRAILSDKVSDLENLIKSDLDAMKGEERARRSTRRFIRIKNFVEDIGESGEDVSGLDKVLEDTKSAFEEGDMDKAEDLMEDIERTQSLIRYSKKGAEDYLQKAKSSLTQAHNLEMDVSDAEELLLVAETLLSEENFLEAIEKAKHAYTIAEEGIPAESVTKKKEMEERLSMAKSLLDEARMANIDVTDSRRSLAEAERATGEGRFRDAENLIAQVEKMAKNLSFSLEEASGGFIASIRFALDKMSEAGISVPQVDSMYRTAKEYQEDGKFQKAVEYAKMAQELLEESEKSIEISAKENFGTIKEGIEQARATGARVEEVEVILEDASKAIEEKDYSKYKVLVEKAEGSLKEAETVYLSNRAIQELEKANMLIEEAESLGVGHIDEAKIVMKKADEAFESKNYGIVSMLTDTAKEMIGESRKKRLIEEFVGKSKVITELIEKAGEAGVDAEDVEGLFKSAQESFGEDNYEAALKLVQQSENMARNQIGKYLKERFPKVLVNLPPGGVQSNTWNKYVFELVNEGTIAAEDVSIDIKGDFEVKGLKKVASLLPNEKKKMEVGLKPTREGDVPVDISVTFKKPFDETNFELRKESNLNISRLGTYLVDDVFLVHNDGRLIMHEAREFKEEVDDDIFSGMLTVMQEFVKDSFGVRATMGLSRMDFGDSKVVIERGHYVYLAAILTGEEPALLPLYMAEVVKEIEDKYSERLEDWSGLLSEMEGVEEIVRKLIFVSDDEEAEIGDLEASQITATLEMLRDAQSAGADVTMAQDLLNKAKQLLEEQDYESAWRCVEEAAESASKSKSKLRGQIENALVAAQTAVDDARELGLEVGKADSLLEDAQEAVENLEVDEVNSIVEKINEIVNSAKERDFEKSITAELEKAQVVIEKLSSEGVPFEEAEELVQEAVQAKLRKDFEEAERYLQMFRETISKAEETAELDMITSKLNEFKFLVQNAKELGLDVSEVEEKIGIAEEAMIEGDEGGVKEALREVGELLEEAKGVLSSAEIETYLESVRDMVERAKAIGIEVTDAESILNDASQLDSEDVEKLRTFIGNAERSATEMISDYMGTRSPAFKLKFPQKGLQADIWNKYVFEIANEGNTAARNVDVDLSGDFEVKGLKTIPNIDVNEKKEVEVGLRPKKEGETPIDVKIYYQKYFDEEKYSLDDLEEVSVESQGTYLVEDVFLIHRDGRLIAHESRKYREEIDEDVFSGMLSVVQDFVKDSFKSKGKVGLKRLDFGESKIMMERGKLVSVAAVLVGQEPKLLPLHILEVIAKIEAEFEEVLGSWSGLMSDLSGIREFIKELIFVTDKKDALPEGLESSLVTATFGVEGAQQIIDEARRVMETEDMDTAWEFVSELGSVAVPDEFDGEIAYPETSLSPEFLKELGELAESTEFRGHVAMISEIVQCVSQARRDLELGQKFPISFVAIKPEDDASTTVISDFKRVLQDHLRAKELIVVPPDEDWEGLDLEISVNVDKIVEIYPQWSRKIQMLLESQSPWKIKAGLDKGSYGLGIEGQKVSIDSGMVSYEISVPEHVAEYKFGKGSVYIDKTQPEELRAEGYAGEIIEEIEKTREEAGIEQENPVEIKICVSEELKTLLEDWIDDIVTEVRCTSFKFRPADWQGDGESHSVEMLLGDEHVKIFLKETSAAEA